MRVVMTFCPVVVNELVMAMTAAAVAVVVAAVGMAAVMWMVVVGIVEMKLWWAMETHAADDDGAAVVHSS